MSEPTTAEAEARGQFKEMLNSLVKGTRELGEKFATLADSYAAFADMGDKMPIQTLADFATLVAARSRAQAALAAQTGTDTVTFMQDVMTLLREWLGTKIQP